MKIITDRELYQTNIKFKKINLDPSFKYRKKYSSKLKELHENSKSKIEIYQDRIIMNKS